MLIRLLLAFAVPRDLTVRGQGQAIQTLTSKYKEKRGTISFKSNQEYTDGTKYRAALVWSIFLSGLWALRPYIP